MLPPTGAIILTVSELTAQIKGLLCGKVFQHLAGIIAQMAACLGVKKHAVAGFQ